MTILKICLHCKKEFDAERNAREYCGRKCTGLSRRISGPCTICGVKHAYLRPTGLEAWHRHPKTGKIICDSCYGKIPRKGKCVECGKTKSTRWHSNEKGRICHKCGMRVYRKKVKLKVLTHYSKGKLVCNHKNCKINDIDMLSLDHLNDDGSTHRKKIVSNGTGIFIYEWAIRNNYPKIFQVLCYNHNMKKHLLQLRHYIR